MSIVLQKHNKINKCIDEAYNDDMKKLIERNKYLEKTSIYLLKNMYNSFVTNRTQADNYNTLSKTLNCFSDTIEELSLEISNNSLCEICYKNNANVVLGGCSHKICLLCAENINSYSKECPYDRIAYDTIRCITCDKEIDKFTKNNSDYDSDLESESGPTFVQWNTNLDMNDTDSDDGNPDADSDDGNPDAESDDENNTQNQIESTSIIQTSILNWLNPMFVCKSIYRFYTQIIHKYNSMPHYVKRDIFVTSYIALTPFIVLIYNHNILKEIKKLNLQNK